MSKSQIDIANITFNHPSSWNLIKIKYLLSTKITDGPHETPRFIDEGYPFLSVDSIVDGKLKFEGCRYISKEDYNKYKLKCDPQKDDIFMGKAASIGKIAIVDVDFNFSIWSPLALLRPNKNIILPKFLEFALKSDYAQDQIELYSTSNTQKNISMDDIPRIELLVPDIEQQKNIVNFLNKKTTKIDSTIAKSEELIKLLEEKRFALIKHVVTKGLNPDVAMKDPGIDWIGEIPEHWNIDKIKKYFRIYNGSTPKDKEENWFGDICWVTPADYKTNDVYINDSARQITKIGLNSCGTTLVPKGSIIVSNRAPIGSVAIANVDLCTNQGCKSLVRKKDINSKFVYYILSVNEKELNKLGRGTTFMELSSYDLGTFKIPIASSSEQNDIVSFLDKEISKINKTSSKIKENITLLKEYKTSLIHHVVTGKIDVRDEEI